MAQLVSPATWEAEVAGSLIQVWLELWTQFKQPQQSNKSPSQKENLWGKLAGFWELVSHTGLPHPAFMYGKEFGPTSTKKVMLCSSPWEAWVFLKEDGAGLDGEWVRWDSDRRGNGRNWSRGNYGQYEKRKRNRDNTLVELLLRLLTYSY